MEVNFERRNLRSSGIVFKSTYADLGLKGVIIEFYRFADSVLDNRTEYCYRICCAATNPAILADRHQESEGTLW